LLGVAVAGIMTAATTLVADYYEGQARAQFMGWQAAFMSFGGVVFLTAGGGLTELGWRWPFTIYLFAILMVPLVMASLFEPVQATKPSVKNGHEKLVGTPKRLLALIYGLTFSGMAIFYFIPMQIPFYLNEMVVAGPAVIGMAIAVATLFGMVTSLSYGRVRARIGYIPILGLTFSLMGSGFLLIGLGNGYLPVLAGLAISGLGSGLMFPNMNVWLTSEVPAAVRGRAVGGLTTAIFLGQFMSPIMGQPIVDNFGLGPLFWGAGAVLMVVASLLIAFRRPLFTFIQTAKPQTVVGTPISIDTLQREREVPQFDHRD
jgi:MFS family permease